MDETLGTNALDFIDFHAYGNEQNANRVLSEVHMVTAYAATVHNVHLPSVLSETSLALQSDANWTNRAYHFTSFLSQEYRTFSQERCRQLHVRLN